MSHPHNCHNYSLVGNQEEEEEKTPQTSVITMSNIMSLMITVIPYFCHCI